MMKIPTAICAVLIFVCGCGPTEDSAQDESPLPTGPQADVESIRAEEGDEQDSADTLSSLEDLLPEEFSVVTEPWHGDLDGMTERHAIRVLVVSGGPQFFYLNGKPRGIMVELLIRFQRLLNEELGRGLHVVEIIPMPVSRDRLIPALIAGQADLIAADLTITQHRSELVDFSIPLARDVDEVLVFSPEFSVGIGSIDDFAGRSVYVRESSSFFEHLTALNKDFAARGLDPIHIESANELLRTQDILEMVNAGLVDATVLNEYQAKYWGQIFPDVEVRDDLVTNSGGEIAWVFRKDSPELAEIVNKFVRQHREGTLIGNILIKRYLENVQWVHDAASDDSLERLRPILDLFRIG